MNYIIAKLKGRKNELTLRILTSTDKSVYESISNIISDSVPYDPSTLLEDGEWYSINHFSHSFYVIEEINRDFDPVEYDSITSDEKDSIDYFYVKQDNIYYFQSAGKTKLIKKKFVLHKGGDFEYSDDTTALIIEENPDAVYDKETDSLYFRSMSKASKFFDDIIILYKEATIEVTEDFLKMDCIQLENGFDATKVGTANRKRIALAVEALDSLTAEEKETVFTYIQEYCPEMQSENGKFRIGCDKELKLFLYGANQRFYTTVAGNEKRIANSIIKMSVEAKING